MTQILIDRTKPPIYEKLKEKFGADWDKNLIVAWDGKIHTKGEIPAQKIIHEKVHLDEQAKIGNEAWWNLYFDNPVFRLEQEVLAHKREAQFIKQNIKDREVAFRMIIDIARVLSSSLYDLNLTTDEALKMIK